jgi:hypothetical protein
MPTKKVVASGGKKVVRKSVAAKRAPVRASLPEPVYVMDLPTVADHVMMPPEMVPEARAMARVVYLAGCKSCNHIPLGVNMVVGVLVAIIFTLSAMLMASSISVRGNAAEVQAYHRLLNPASYASVTKTY